MSDYITLKYCWPNAQFYEEWYVLRRYMYDFLFNGRLANIKPTVSIYVGLMSKLMHAGQTSFVDDGPQNTVNLNVVHIHAVSFRGMDASGSL